MNYNNNQSVHIKVVPPSHRSLLVLPHCSLPVLLASPVLLLCLSSLAHLPSLSSLPPL